LLTVSFSKKEGDEITVVTNLGEFYEPDDFATFLPFIVNLEPVKLGGVMSEAMIIVGKSQTDGFEGNIELTYADYTMGSKLL
jgi:tRNA-binding EMAP/Myf-like protein